MKSIASFLAILLAGLTAIALQAQATDYSETAPAQAAANSRSGARHSPAHVSPVPTNEVSPQMQALIGAPYPPFFNAAPKDTASWKELIKQHDAPVIAIIPALKEKLGVDVQTTKIAGVNVFIVTPKNFPSNNKGRLLMHLHGGGYIFGAGVSALPEAIFLAGYGGYKVVSVDYRMPPDFPYPAAMDDAMAVWKELIKTNKPANMAVFGTSTGGAMTLALVHRAKAEKVPLPAAIAPGTPWADIAKIGDTYETNEWIDNVLVTGDGLLGKAALLYAAGHDLKDPQLSPIYGDFSGFPPALLTTGTRDLFLSNTVRTHRKLRRAGVVADLNVYEGQSHAQYSFNPGAPETKEAFTDVASFFDKHLGQSRTTDKVDGRQPVYQDIYGRYINITTKTEISCPPQTDKTVVALVFGQSNSANHDGQRVLQKSPKIINFFNDKCYIASDPLLGATGTAGSVWTLLGTKLLATEKYDNIIFVPAGIGGTKIERWEQGGDLNAMLGSVVTSDTKKYSPTHLIWHQGESDNNVHTTKEVYKRHFNSMVQTIRNNGVKAPVYVSIASLSCGNNADPDNSVTKAQRELIASGNGILMGPNTDTLIGPEDRYDGCHMSYVGQQKFSDLLMQTVFK